MKRFCVALAAMGAIVAFTVPALAHHSHGNYVDQTTDMEGTVTEVHLLVPHSWVYLEVKKGSETEIWSLEATNRQGLEKIGVTKDYLKAGDKIKARCHVLRDGSNGCLLGYLKGPDGAVKDWDGGTGPAPADFN
jgi:hypothetical protein